MSLSITLPDGSFFEQEGNLSNLVGPAFDLSPIFSLDGKPVNDLAELLSGHQVEIAAGDDNRLLIQRDGRRLIRVSPWMESSSKLASSIEWNQDLDTVWIELPSGTAVVTLDGQVDQTQKARFIGYLATMALGGGFGFEHHEASDVAKFYGAGAVFIVLAVLALLGYALCMIVGSGKCKNAAEDLCGKGQVQKYKVICGAGTDVNGKFQLGYGCSVLCK